MSPVIHPSQVMPVPTMPTMANLPVYAAMTPQVITPPKRPRFLPPSETPLPVEQGFAQPLQCRVVGMSHSSVTFQSIPTECQIKLLGILHQLKEK